MSRQASLDGVRSVLVVKPSSLGDIVHTLPSVHLLKRARPDLKIRWVVNTEWAPLLEGNPDLDEVVLFPRKEVKGIFDLHKLRGFFAKLRGIKPDLALDFQGLLRSSLIARISGARDIHCLGDAECLTRLLSHRVVPATRRGEHSVTRYLKLIADLGIEVDTKLEFPMPAGEKPQGVMLPERYLLVHPFSRGTNKSIPGDCLHRLFELLGPVPVVLAGGRADETFEIPEGCVNLLNKTSLSELIWLIRHAHFTVSVDSGPMHIAAAITPDLLGIHNWTNPKLVGPYNPDAWIWKNGTIRRMCDFVPSEEPDGEHFGMQHAGQVADFLKSRFQAVHD